MTIIMNLFLWLPVVLAILSPGRTDADYPGNVTPEQGHYLPWIKQVTAKYSPDTWFLLQQYERLPERLEAPSAGGGTVTTGKPADAYYYLSGKSKLDLLNSMETNVHETAHGYFNLNVFRYISKNDLTFDWDNVQGYIYLSPEKGFYVSCPSKILFPSSELKAAIPRSLRTFRYDDYIEGNSSTQDYGVVGLLDELHAYYLGSEYCYDMLEAYKETGSSAEEGFLDWVAKSQSTMTAFWEFDFFIKEYLLFMKKKYPAGYRELLACGSFREAYNEVYHTYSDLVKSYEEKVHYGIEEVNKAGRYEATLEESVLWIKPRDSMVRQGTPLFSEAKEILQKVLTSGRYDAVEEEWGI